MSFFAFDKVSSITAFRVRTAHLLFAVAPFHNQEARGFAFGARLAQRRFAENKMTVRIIGTGIKYASSLGHSFNQISAACWAGNSDGIGFCVSTFGVA